MLSHAWPIILVLVLIFGGAIRRSIVKALFGGVSAAINAPPAQNVPPQAPQLPVGPTAAIGAANAEAVRIAVARAAARRTTLAAAAAALATKGGGSADLAEFLREVAAAVPAAAPVPTPAPVPARQEKAAQHKSATAVNRSRHAPLGEPLAPLDPVPRLRASHRIAALAPLEPRVPLAPLAARRA